MRARRVYVFRRWRAKRRQKACAQRVFVLSNILSSSGGILLATFSVSRLLVWCPRLHAGSRAAQQDVCFAGDVAPGSFFFVSRGSFVTHGLHLPYTRRSSRLRDATRRSMLCKNPCGSAGVCCCYDTLVYVRLPTYAWRERGNEASEHEQADRSDR